MGHAFNLCCYPQPEPPIISTSLSATTPDPSINRAIVVNDYHKHCHYTIDQPYNLVFAMRLPRWLCCKCGDGTMESTTRLHHCLLCATMLLCFIVDTIAALDLGQHNWPLRMLLETSTLTSSHTAVSIIAFFTASTIIYRVNVHDQWQDLFLLTGITSGATSGLLLKGGLQEAILQFIPWTVMLSLLLSTILHRTVQFARCRSPVLEEKAPLLP